MKYLQASKLVKNCSFPEKKPLLLASSGQTENLDIYIRAEFALREIDCQVSHNAFNTLEQQLISPQEKVDLQAIILMPWDFLPALDWRTGININDSNFDTCLERIERFTRLLGRQLSHCIFVDAPVPPVFTDLRRQKNVGKWIYHSAIEVCQAFHESSVFNLDSYLEYGVPFTGNSCGLIASGIVDLLNSHRSLHHKLIITDLDNVMWRGVIGEDGIEGLQYSPRGDGYIHYLYQSYLKKLKNAGILLAAISKNDPDLASLPFSSPDMLLDEDDLITIQASYHSKSRQIKKIADCLNLSVDAFVFIDDNPIEIEEVQRAIPEISTLLFPGNAAELAGFFERLSALFDLRETTVEDVNRTSLYKTRLKGMIPSTDQGSDLLDFLKDLQMEICIHDRSLEDNERALQLFNKTNQFNINGHRISREELDKRLENGCRLYTATLSDRYGKHGEVLACLLDESSDVELLVMSCRVFQRRVEHFFLAWLARYLQADNQHQLRLKYRQTERNTPVRLFLEQNNIYAREDWSSIAVSDFINMNSSLDALFKLTVEQ